MNNAIVTNDKLLLTYADAGRLLSLSERTVWQLVKDGQIPTVRLRGSVRISRRALEMRIAEWEEHEKP